jgi:hypothetical protein
VPGAATDVRLLASEMESVHPDLFATVGRVRFREAVDDLAERAGRVSPDELLVGLMRLAALPGDGNGHGGIFPGDPEHRRRLHLLPLRLYTFPGGTYVVDEAGLHGLVGTRLTAVAGVPWDEVADRVRPLVPHDNASSLRGLLPHYALTAEVLDGLGITDGVGPTELTFARRDGSTTTATLTPISASRYVARFADPHVGHYPSLLPRRKPEPLYLRNSGRDLWVGLLGNGRVIYVGYNTIFTPILEVAGVADRITALARRPKVDRIVVDLRVNGGGDNTTYGPLLQALEQRRIDRPGHLYVLIGRATFSAAANLASDIDHYTRAIFVGEPTGGGVKIYGDAESVVLPHVGLDVRIPHRHWDFGKGPADHRLAVEPDIPVPVTVGDFLTGRDPALAAALTAGVRK